MLFNVADRQKARLQHAWHRNPPCPPIQPMLDPTLLVTASCATSRPRQISGLFAQPLEVATIATIHAPM